MSSLVGINEERISLKVNSAFESSKWIFLSRYQILFKKVIMSLLYRVNEEDMEEIKEH